MEGAITRLREIYFQIVFKELTGNEGVKGVDMNFPYWESHLRT